MTQKISIIVPVYKVENELKKCVDSILNQTYKNIEEILIDDGSPDSCGSICDDYAYKDSRIRVVHQSNRGLSAARNAGLKLATGTVIGFVDSDDWIEPDMYETMLKAMVRENADIVICGILQEMSGKKQIIGVKEERRYCGKEALIHLFDDRVLHNYVWNRIYSRKCIEGFLFEEGRIFEDILFSYKPVARSNSIVYIQEVLYHYVRRPDSILGGRKCSLDIKLLDAVCEQADGIVAIDSTCEIPIRPIMLRKFDDFKKKMLKADIDDIIKNKEDIKDFSECWDKWAADFRKSGIMDVRRDICMTAFYHSPIMYYQLVRAVRRIKRIFACQY